MKQKEPTMEPMARCVKRMEIHPLTPMPRASAWGAIE